MALVGVSNSSPLILLMASGHLDILLHAFDYVIAPSEVADEVQKFPSGLLSVRTVKNRQQLESLASRMGRGEAAAVALALETPDAVVVLDDRKGRRAARDLNLPFVGTVGLVIEAKRRGRIVSARKVFDDLLSVGMFASESVIRAAIEQAGE